MSNKGHISTRRWSINADELQSQYQGYKSCVNQPLPEKLGTGQSSIYRLDADLNYIETFYTPVKDLAILSQIESQEPRLVVTLAIKGHSSFKACFGNDVLFNEGYTTITSFNSSLGERHYEADISLQQLRFSLSERWLDKYFGEGKFKKFFKKNGVQTVSYRPISHQGLIAAHQLLNCNIPTQVRAVFMHGQALSLLAYELYHLSDETSKGALRQNKKEMALANTARDILSQEFRNPPSVEELARRVGVNQLKLKQLFHRFFDTTPYSLLLEIRMNNAYKLLESTHCQVAVAADFAGYNHASNFSTAFIRYFGVSPKSISRNN